MKLISFYAIHTIRNIIKRLLHSKAGIGVILFLFFFVFVFIMSTIGDRKEDLNQKVDIVATSQEEDDSQLAINLVSMLSSGIIVLYIMYKIATGDKKGTGMFRMSDVNLLFAAPIRPQTVFVFRLILSMGTTLAASIYLLFQLPNLVINAGLGGVGAFGILGAYVAMLILGNVLSMLMYCISATHPRFQASLKPVCIGILATMVLIFVILVSIIRMNPLDAGIYILGQEWFYGIPIIGWLKGLIMACVLEQTSQILLYILMLVVSFIIITLIVYHVPVDFYEDAIEGAKKFQDITEASKEGRTKQRVRKAKTLRTEHIEKGFGANAFYYKSIFIRNRGAKLYIFSETSQGYYIVCITSALILSCVVKEQESIILAVITLFMTYIISMASTVTSEIYYPFIFLVPEPYTKKVLCCTCADLQNFILDTFVPYLIASVLVKADIMFFIASYFGVVAFYFMSNQMGAWIDLLLPSTIVTQIRLTICMLLKMLALIPGLIVFLICYAMNPNGSSFVITGLISSAFVMIIFGIVFMSACPSLLNQGRK